MYYLLLLIGISFLLPGSLPPTSKRMRTAIVHGKIKQVKRCLEAGQTPVGVWPQGGITPLMMALRWHKTDIAELFTTLRFEDQAKLQTVMDPIFWRVFRTQIRYQSL